MVIIKPTSLLHTAPSPFSRAGVIMLSITNFNAIEDDIEASELNNTAIMITVIAPLFFFIVYASNRPIAPLFFFLFFNVAGGFFFFILRFIHFPIYIARFEQLFVLADCGNLTVVEHDYLVGVHDGRRPLGNDYFGRIP